MAIMAGIGVFDLFTVGIGPSSSHTVGPMLAAQRFVSELARGGHLAATASVGVDLYGSLAATGRGHGTLDAVLLGLEGNTPGHIDPEAARARIRQIAGGSKLRLNGSSVRVSFGASDIRLRPLTVLPRHPNALRFEARDSSDTVIGSETYYSVGGGFIEADSDAVGADQAGDVRYPFGSGEELLRQCEQHGYSIARLALLNEAETQTEAMIEEGLDRIADAMDSCIGAGLRNEGVLPGGLDVPRRARAWHEKLLAEPNPLSERYAPEWAGLFALAVNEENAAGGRVVTAPTNGAAGVVPAVLRYATMFRRDDLPAHAHRTYLLTAAAIGALIKSRASISGADVGCQGEIGSACAMAAAGLAAVLGGHPAQITNAAEIAMEHNLGLTCDPVGGLVQVPCIERNAIAATKAINAAAIALRGDGQHRVSLDDVIETMRRTGADMADTYKETARGGLAAQLGARWGVGLVEC